MSMNNKQYVDKKDVFALLVAFSGQGNILSIQKEYLVLCDYDYEAAVFLSQIIYWSDKSYLEDGWIYKTYAEWEKELFIKERKLRRLKDYLVAKGYIEMRLLHRNGIPVCHWRVTVKVIDSLLMLYTGNREEKAPASCSHNTDEIPNSEATDGNAQQNTSQELSSAPEEAMQEHCNGAFERAEVKEVSSTVIQSNTSDDSNGQSRISPSGQNDRMHPDKIAECIRTNCPNPSGQNDRIHPDKMTGCTNNIDYIHQLHSSITSSSLLEVRSSLEGEREKTAMRKKEEEEKIAYQKAKNPSVTKLAEEIYALFVEAGINKADQFLVFLQSDFKQGLAKLQERAIPLDESILGACKNYVQVLALQKSGKTWWKSRLPFNGFCSEKIISRFLPDYFAIAAFELQGTARSPPSPQDFSEEALPELFKRSRLEHSCDEQDLFQGVVF